MKTAHERKTTAAFMMIIGGMMGAYTFLVRGHVFCNAQTGNFLLFGVALANGSWKEALYYLIPFASYLAGSMISEVLRTKTTPRLNLKWTTCFLGLELISFFVIGLIPLNFPNSLVQCLIMFLAANQYNSFRKAGEINMATTFCTNHVRQLGIGLVTWKQNRDPKMAEKIRLHLFMLLCFTLGVVIMTIGTRLDPAKSIWLAMIPCMAAFIIVLKEDLAGCTHLHFHSFLKI